eukprot:scaffold246_cov414-Prasinococcus_capsulatus_cf.AAC.13
MSASSARGDTASCTYCPYCVDQRSCDNGCVVLQRVDRVANRVMDIDHAGDGEQREDDHEDLYTSLLSGAVAVDAFLSGQAARACFLGGVS